MKTVILAAGKGERLKPITDTRPKPLIPILCRPLIEWQIEAIEKFTNTDELIIVLSYMKEKIESTLNSLSNVSRRVKIKIVDQREEKGTGDAVLKALQHVDPGEDVLIIYGDIFLKDWSILSTLTSSKSGENIVVATEVTNPSDYGVLVVKNGKLLDLIEKPKQPLSRLVNAGIYKLSANDILKHGDVALSPRGEIEFTDIVLKIARSKGVRVLEIPSGTWIDVGLPWNVIDANKIALEQIKHDIKGTVEDYVTIKKPVYIGEGTTVRSGTYIEGPVYVGKNVDIGPSARIRPYTVICDGSRIGFSVEVKESVIMENVHASHLSYIGDSIICEGVNLGAGTVIANLRFDEKPVAMYIKGEKVSSGRRKLGAVIGAYVKTGVNVSIMPGVKIGSYSWIAPGAVVYRDVPSKVFYKVEIKYFMEKLEEYIRED